MSKFHFHTLQWDPLSDSDTTVITPAASNRIKRDLMNLFTDPPFGLFVVGDETNIKFIHAIVMGVMDTPYEGGFFYFVLKCPSDYPIRPPKVKLMTTDAGRVRFNPNMYSSGKVCLSILGTWNGPAWSPAQHLSSLLISIQSLMNDNPYFNEPGYTAERVPEDVALEYAEIIRHETLRVAVCGMLENECSLNIPEELQTIMEKTFLQFYDQYIETANKHLHLDSQPMIDPFTGKQSTYQYATLLKRLNALYTTLSAKHSALLPELHTLEHDSLSEDESTSSSSK